eukprot:6171252-Pleurochrysis_carterae.AAC.1
MHYGFNLQSHGPRWPSRISCGRESISVPVHSSHQRKIVMEQDQDCDGTRPSPTRLKQRLETESRACLLS